MISPTTKERLYRLDNRTENVKIRYLKMLAERLERVTLTAWAHDSIRCANNINRFIDKPSKDKPSIARLEGMILHAENLLIHIAKDIKT